MGRSFHHLTLRNGAIKMRFRFPLFLILAFIPFSVHAQQSEPVVSTTDDNVLVYGDRYVAEGGGRATILLFHQAGASRAEYEPIIPRLLKSGFDVVAIDQRSGGSRFDGENKTVRRLERSTDFLEALPDLEAAMNYARFVNPANPIIAWGSSYSASLAFLLAAKHPDKIAAVMAFSPGEYFPDKSLVRTAASKVSVPIFATSSPKANEVEAAKAILAASPSQLKMQYVPEAGVHGASILRTDANPQGADAAWSAVNDFLNKLVRAGAG